MKSDEVAQYLQDNPQFFEDYADLMSRVVIPHPHGGRTISITERQMLSLRDKNRQLEAKLGELLQFGEENDVISEKMHRLGVAVIAAGTFQSVIHTLNFHLRDDFAIPISPCVCGVARRIPPNCLNSLESARSYRHSRRP